MANTSTPFNIQRHSTSLPSSITDGTMHFMKNGSMYLDWDDERVQIGGVAVGSFTATKYSLANGRSLAFADPDYVYVVDDDLYINDSENMTADLDGNDLTLTGTDAELV